MMLGPIVTIPKNIPLIHFFGGAITEGASIDELTRHAITKTSHFHFVLLNNYKKRLYQLGEEKWRIKTIGMPSLHRFVSLNKNSLIQIGKKYNFDFLKPFVIVTFHPVTTELDKLKKQIKSLIQAIKLTNMNAVITYPNSDPKYDLIIQEYKKNFRNKKKYFLINNLTEKDYFVLLRFAKLVIGNSSSGIVEAASFKIPVINIGTRQNGKIKPLNVINSKYDKSNILKAIKKTTKKIFYIKIKKTKKSL